MNRHQLQWLEVNREESIGPEHPAGLIGALLGGFDLSGFEEEIATQEGQPCWPRRRLLSVWVYGYQQGVGSARAQEKRMR